MPWRERFRIHEIGRIDGGRGFRTGKNVFRIGGNTFYDWRNEILMKIPEFKRSGIGLIAEFCGLPNGFPNLGLQQNVPVAYNIYPIASPFLKICLPALIYPQLNLNPIKLLVNLT